MSQLSYHDASSLVHHRQRVEAPHPSIVSKVVDPLLARTVSDLVPEVMEEGQRGGIGRHRH